MYTLRQSFVPGDISYPTGGHWYDPLIQAGAQILQRVTQPKTTVTIPTTTTEKTVLGIDTTTLLLIGGAVLLVVLSSKSRRRS